MIIIQYKKIHSDRAIILLFMLVALDLKLMLIILVLKINLCIKTKNFQLPVLFALVLLFYSKNYRKLLANQLNPYSYHLF